MIPLHDDGLYRGDGVFEVIRLYGGRPFALDDHLDRLERSAAAIELAASSAPRSSPRSRRCSRRNGDADAQLRLIVTRGGRRIALIEPLVDWGETVRLATVTYAPTVILTGVKSLSYGANMQATRIAKARGADEALLVRPDGIVLEAPTSTIFWVAGGELRTPVARDAGSSTRSPGASLVDGARRRRGRVRARRPARRRARPSSPRPRARSSRSRRSTTSPSSRARAPPRRSEAFDARGRRRRSASAGRDDRAHRRAAADPETARDFVDNEVIPRARDSDRAAELRRRARPPARRDGLPRARRSPRSTAAAGSTTSATG